MIDSMVCKVYKLNKEYVFSQKLRDGKLIKDSIDKGRIILHASYINPRGYPKKSIWILATQTRSAETLWWQRFDQMQTLKPECLDEINIEDEYDWINDHLNKQVRFYLRHSKYLTSRVLFEKYKKFIPSPDLFINNGAMGAFAIHERYRHYYNMYHPSLFRRIVNFIKKIL